MYEEEQLRLAQGLSSLPRKSEEDAKREWLAKVSPPAWGQTAESLSQVASQAANVEQLAADCDRGDYAACENLSREEEAKKAYLAKLDVPALDIASMAVSAVAVEAQSVALTNKLSANCYAGDNVACEDWSREEEAKRAWLNQQPALGSTVEAASALISQEEAKRAWLARLDQRTWGTAATNLASAASNASASARTTAGMDAACNSGDYRACDNLSREEEAKLAWLGQLDAKTWGAAAASVSAIAMEKSKPLNL